MYFSQRGIVRSRSGTCRTISHMEKNASCGRVVSSVALAVVSLVAASCVGESAATTLDPLGETVAPTSRPTSVPEPTVQPTATPEPTSTPTAVPEPTAEPTPKPVAESSEQQIVLPAIRAGGVYDYPTSGMEAITDQDLAQAVYTAIEFANASLELNRDQATSNDRLLAVRPQVFPDIIEQELAFHNNDPANFVRAKPKTRNVDLRLQYGRDGELFVILCQQVETELVSRSTGEAFPLEKGTVERVVTFANEGWWVMAGVEGRHGELGVFHECPEIDTIFEPTR